MKVFQVCGAAGEWEDYHKWVINTYLHKEVAQKKLKQAKDEIEEEYCCLDCPYNNCYPEKPIETDCPKHEPVNIWEDEDAGEPEYDCDNRRDDYDKPSFWIEEIEVDESEE